MSLVVVKSLGQRTLDEHAHLRTVTEAMANAVSHPPELPVEDPAGKEVIAKWRHGVEEMLGNLMTTIRDHMAREETSPMYMEGTEFLRFAPELERLLEQHAEIRRWGSRLEEMVQSARPDVFALDLTKFLMLVDAHERAENEILQDAFTHDLGGGD